MQTFLPLPFFSESAAVLDYRRLGKQRVEAKQILMGLLRIDKDGNPLYPGEPSTSERIMAHPASKMWYGYEGALIDYTVLMCLEWMNRGYKSSVQSWLSNAANTREISDFSLPPWIHDSAVYESHQAVLLAKDPAHYSQFDWDVEPALLQAGKPMPYVWPISDRERTINW